MPTQRKTERPHFAGIRRGCCKNPECPVREVFYALKRDPEPDASAVCPRCRSRLTLFRWCEEPERRLAELELEGNEASAGVVRRRRRSTSAGEMGASSIPKLSKIRRCVCCPYHPYPRSTSE